MQAGRRGPLASATRMPWAGSSAPTSAANMLRSIYPGVIQLDQAQSFVLAAGEEVRAEFAMRQVKTVQVAGRIVASDGKRRAMHLSCVFRFRTGQIGVSNQVRRPTPRGISLSKALPPESYIINRSATRSRETPCSRGRNWKLGMRTSIQSCSPLARGQTFRDESWGQAQACPIGFRFSWSPRMRAPQPTSGGAQSKPDGSFQMIGVPDGDYALRVYGMEQGWYMRSARLGGEDVLEKGLQVEKGSSVGRSKSCSVRRRTTRGQL